MPQASSRQTLPVRPWKVFLSHTSELRAYPQGELSFVNQAERAVSASGHVIVDMADFPALDQVPAEVCVERVRACDVYVGLFGLRYGSPVRDQPSRSYTELEFDTATEAGLPRLIFIVDSSSTQLGVPPAAVVDHRYGERQEAFLKRVCDSGLTVQRFRNPDDLRDKVSRALGALAGPGPQLATTAVAASRPVPELLPYLPDRDPQEARMRTALQGWMQADRAGPMVVILHGEEDQRLERFRDRVVQAMLPTLFGATLASRDCHLPWPADLIPDARFFEQFRQRINHHLLAESTGEVPTLAALADRAAPLLLWSSLYTDDWGSQGAQRFAQVCRFWREDSLFADLPVIHWIAIKYKKPPAYQPRILWLRWLERRYWQHRHMRRRLRRRNGQIRATLHGLDRSDSGGRSPLVLPELTSVRRGDAESWARSQPVRQFLREQSPQGLEDAVGAFYRHWEHERGMAEIPLEELGRFLLEQLRQAAAGPR